MHPWPGSEHGYSFIDLLFALAVMAIVCGAAVPQAIAMFERPRTHAAARYLSSRMTRAHTQAVMRTATIALRFTPEPGGVRLDEILDGNRNGVRSVDIGGGIDRPLAASMRFSDQFPRVTIDVSEVTLMSFTPVGTATSRTIYLRGADGSRYGVRVLGATGRTRVIRYDAAVGDWIEVL